MPVYRIHRLKPHPRQQFRWAPHTIGSTGVKPRDYEGAGVVEAAGMYAAWTALRGTDQALDVGDLLEAEDGKLSIFKYVGFEEAVWVLPEPPAIPSPVVAAQPSA
jgi:hypothetical protein